MVTTRKHRSGTTLMEVLIATMILSVGLVAIMALFPIGALNFARAINQDRSATHGVNSDAMFRFYWKSAWVERDSNFAPTGTSHSTTAAAYDQSLEPMLLLLDAHPGYGPLSPGNFTDPGNSGDPSFPVMVDPIGLQTKSGFEQAYVGGNMALPVRTTLRTAISGFPSRLYLTPDSTPPGSMNPAAPYFPYPPAPAHFSDIRKGIRLTTLLDDITFDANANVDTAATLQVERAGRYNVAWLLRRERNNVKQEVHIHVLVYGGRAATDVPSPETAFQNSTTGPGQKTIQVPLGGQAPPNLRKGGWIAFSHLVTPVFGASSPTLDFYRVVGVNDETPGMLLVEIETSIKVEGPANSYSGYAIVFDNLLEVFDRGLVSSSGVTGQ